jgi:hypothetical protein
MKELIGPLEAMRRLASGRLGTRERITDAIRGLFQRPKPRPLKKYIPILDSAFYKPQQRSF